MLTHDPLRQINYLRQVLSHNKKPLAFFLGAGCPTAIPHPTDTDGTKRLIPNIDGLTKHVVESFEKHEHKDIFQTLYSHFKEDGNDTPNIEQILSHIRLLQQVCGASTVRKLSLQDLGNLEKAICDEICNVMNQKLLGNHTPYHKLATWIMSRQRDYPIELFTTNYDLLIEQALEENGVPYFDGFVGGREPFFDTHAVEMDILPSRWARVWKLHGSINWYQSEPESPVIRGYGLADGKKRVLIHPSHLKYDESRKMPYLALLDKLKAFLKETSAGLITCGYSFGDKHINNIIIEGLKGNPTAIAFGLLHGPIEKYENVLKIKRSNLNLLAIDEGIIGTRKGKWNKERIDSEHTGINYVKKGDDIKEIKFTLGDYQELGKFLIEFIGEDKDEELSS